MRRVAVSSAALMLTGFRIGIASGTLATTIVSSLSAPHHDRAGLCRPDAHHGLMDEGISKTMRLPDFLGIGTQKGGTTYLHGLLQQHPQVYLANPKELHYFSLHHHRGLEWYCHHFDTATADQCCGEVTPYYLFHPFAAERIATALPNVKLIVLLRDPVERTLSQYFHSKRLGLEPLELEEALAAEPQRLADAEAALKRGEVHKSHQQHSYLSRSRYERQLFRFEKLFLSAQMLVLSSEDLFEHPKQIWERVLAFLELDNSPLPESELRYAGRGESDSVSPGLRQQLRAQSTPTFQWLDKR